MAEKKIITLHQLEKLWHAHIGGTGLPNHPMELSPAYRSFCKRNWTAWHDQRRRRYEQLDDLDMLDTHDIDYYIETKPILPI
jgi:hypothetical protein